MACVWRVSDQASFPMTPPWFRFTDSASAGVLASSCRVCLPPCGLKHNRRPWPAGSLAKADGDWNREGYLQDAVRAWQMGRHKSTPEQLCLLLQQSKGKNHRLIR
ncbi:hypothetical protein ACQJBY_051421 [Aegilops geniculata]